MATIPHRPISASPLPTFLLLLLLLLLLTVRYAEPQESVPFIPPPPSPPPPPSIPGAAPNGSSGYTYSFTITSASISALLVLAFFLLCFFTACRSRLSRSPSTSPNPNPSADARRDQRSGLDPAAAAALPTMTYAAAKALRAETEGPLECAVCLAEFDGADETLRLLPRCCHVFHPSCIDPWLESHVTCPLCRADLSDLDLPARVDCRAEQAPIGPDRTEQDLVEADRTEPDEEVEGEGHRRTRSAANRHTLCLPEHVRREMEVAGTRLRRAASLTDAEDVRRQRRRQPSNGRWGLFLRTLSGRWWETEREEEEQEEEGGTAGPSNRVYPLSIDPDLNPNPNPNPDLNIHPDIGRSLLSSEL